GMGEPVSANPFLETDVPCAQCGYNLRTLRADGRCPECGSDVGPSIWIHRRKQQRRPQPPELLSAADPHWVRQLKVGAAFAVLVFLLMIAMSLAPNWVYELRTTLREGMLGFA